MKSAKYKIWINFGCGSTLDTLNFLKISKLNLQNIGMEQAYVAFKSISSSVINYMADETVWLIAGPFRYVRSKVLSLP
jgi:hypothetical protein